MMWGNETRITFTFHLDVPLTPIGCPLYRACEEQKGLSFGER